MREKPKFSKRKNLQGYIENMSKDQENFDIIRKRKIKKMVLHFSTQPTNCAKRLQKGN